MARTRQPIATLEAAGSFDRHPERKNKRLSDPHPVGSLGYAPNWFNQPERDIWNELVRSAPVKLGRNDRCLLEIVCVLKAKLQARTLENGQFPHLISGLKQLGFITPERQPIEQKKETDPWDERFNNSDMSEPQTNTATT